MKKILSVLLVLLLIMSFPACSESGGKSGSETEITSEKSLSVSEIQNESIRNLVSTGRLVSQADYDLPTTLGLLRGIADGAKYEKTVYDELPAMARNVSKYQLDGILESAESVTAQTGKYTFIRTGCICIILDDLNENYRIMKFSDGQKTYEMLGGSYGDFSNSYFYKNKEYAGKTSRHMTVKEETNETLMCVCVFPLSENESVKAVYDENGEMMFCFNVTDNGEKYYNGNFTEISSEETEIEEFADRINKKYGIELRK